VLGQTEEAPWKLKAPGCTPLRGQAPSEQPPQQRRRGQPGQTRCPLLHSPSQLRSVSWQKASEARLQPVLVLGGLPLVPWVVMITTAERITKAARPVLAEMGSLANAQPRKRATAGFA